MTNVHVIEPAQVPTRPVHPNLFLNLILAALFGLLGGAGLMVFVEYIDDRFYDVDDVENWLEIPVLASVGKLEITQGKSGRS